MPNDLPNISVDITPPQAPDTSLTKGMFSAAQLQAPLAPDAPVKYTPTPGELASATPVATGPVKYTPTPEELASATPVATSAFEAMTPEQMVVEAKANPRDFDPIAAFQALPYTKQRELYEKAADTYHQLRTSGVTTPSLMDLIRNTGKSIKDLAKTGATLANIGIESPVAVPTAIESGLTGQPLDTSTFSGALAKQAQQESGEFLAGQKLAGLGLGQMMTKGAAWVGRQLHITKPLDQYSEADKLDAFGAELATRNGLAQIAKEGISPERAAALAKEGYGLRPEKVEEAASGSPYAWEAAGKIFGAAGAVGSDAAAAAIRQLHPELQAAIARLPATASAASAKVVGGTLNLAGRAGEAIAEKAEAVAPTVSKITGAVGGVVAGHHLAGPAGIALGIAEGFKRGGEFGESAATGLGKTAIASSKLAEMGKQVATGEGVSSSTAQFLRDAAQAAPGAVAHTAAGVAMDVGLGASTAETPSEQAGITPFGTVLGAAGAARGAFGRVVSGHIIAPRAWGSEGAPIRPENFSQNFPALNAEHTDGMANATPGVQQRYNAVQKFLDGAAPGTQLVYAPRPEAGAPDTLPQALQESGINPAFADQDGFSTQVKGADGKEHSVIVVRDMQTAPHEARHAMDDVIGAGATEQLNAEAKKQYADKWDAFKQQYADRLTPTGLATSDPDGTILHETGYGDAAAKEKIIAETRDALVQEGQNPTDAQVKEAAASRIQAEQGRAQQAGRDLWQMLLTPAEQAHQVDQYVGSEVRAEHHDAWFKAGQPGTMRGKMAMTAAKVLTALGVNPTAGRVSDYGTPLEGSLVTQASKTAPKVEMAPEAPAPEGTPAAQQQAVSNAQKAAQNASNQPVPGAVKTQKEVLGVIAEAIARKQGVKVTGLFAPDEPAASLTSDRETRRAMIEAFRTMPDAAKKMWGKLFFPENVPVTARGGNLQIFGWAPEVFAANAHKVAGALNALADKGVNISPYELDPTTKTFTEKGWQDLYDDTQKFVQNQMAGRTGSGVPLVVPESVTKAGAAAPPVRGETAPLAQDRADFISSMFHAKLPDTGLARQGAINMPLNKAGQLVSAATIPGRVEPPVEPRGTFRGKVAVQQGVKGEPVMEVNPFRNKLESALKTAGIDKPSLIEVNQRLNLKNIKDVELAPEQGQFRANTLTLQAGFQPPRERAEKFAEENGFKDMDGKPLEINPDGTATLYHWTSPENAKNIRETGLWKSNENTDESFFSNNPDSQYGQGFGSERLKVNVPVTSLRINDASHGEMHFAAPNKMLAKLGKNGQSANFQPPRTPKELVDFLDSVDAKDWMQFKYQGKYGGGQSGLAFDVGGNAKTADDLAMLRSSAQKYRELSRAALKEKNLQAAGDFGSRAQAATEAYEAAADEGGTGDFIRRHHDPTYRGPMATGGPTDEPVKFQPQGKMPPELQDEDLKNASRTAAVWMSPSGQLFNANDAHLFFARLHIAPGVENAVDAALAKGWLRIQNMSGYMTAQTKGIHAKQQSRLDSLAEATGKMIVGDNMHTLAEPSTSQEGGTFQPPRHNEEIRKSASDYMGDRPYTPHVANSPVNEQRAKDIADSYAASTHAPTDPAVKKSYDALKDETVAQWDHLTKAGYKMEPWTNPGQPYATSAEMSKDVRDNKHLWYFPTESGFGSTAGPKDHPLVEDTGMRVNGKPVLFNDAFRAVHDIFGHAKEGFEFGPRGEYNAYLAHSAMFSDEANPAMAAETLGQNSWVNFGPHLRDKSGMIPKKGEPGFVAPQDRPFAEQKATIMSANSETPKLVVDKMPEISNNKGSFMAKRKQPKLDDKWELKPGASQFTKAWILPSGELAQFGGTWHHDWLNEQTELRKRFSIPEVKNAEDADRSRIPAMKGGFTRVNYDKYNGKLTVEARESDWPNVLPSIQELVKNNPNKFDSMQVHLFDKGVKKVSDSDFVSFLEIPADERAQNIPFSAAEGKIPVAQVGSAGEEGSQQLFNKAAGAAFGKGNFQAPKLPSPKPEEFAHNDTIETALAKPNWAILTGTQEAMGDATNKANSENNERLYNQLAKAGFAPIEVSGSYKGIDQGRNFLVTGISPQDALKWGREFKQDSVLTPHGLLYSDGSVQPPDATTTKIGPDAEKEDFFSRVDNGPAFSLGFDEKVKPKAEEMVLGNLGTKKTLSSKEVGDMTKAELAAHYPESVIPKAKDDLIQSNIVDSPLAKEAGEAGFADKLVDFAKSVEKSTGYQAGLKWYSEFVPKLKKVYGKHAQIMAELLAATSPNNAPDTNFAFANDALEGYISGRFDKKISKFNEGLEKIENGSWEKWVAKEDPTGVQSEANFLANWISKHDLNPRQSNGQLYSMHSVPVLRVFARKWLENTTGPKTQNFVKNLLGTGHEATIDVWADRTMRRLGYADSRARWRILPKNGTGVSDADFAFSQTAFRQAAEKLGVTPDALQGGLWFAEKQLWADNGWGRLDLGDYRKEIAKADLLKSGITQRLAQQKAKAKAKQFEQPELLVSARP